MLVVDFPNQAPSVCTVCESANPVPHVDTARNNEYPGALNGRKYMCITCVRDAAYALGLFDEAMTAGDSKIAELEGDLEAAAQRLESLETLEKALATFGKAPARKAAK